MQFISTRGEGPVSLDLALVNGIASDGGLYIPAELPLFATADFGSAQTIIDVANVLLRPFFSNSSLAEELDTIVRETFAFPIPLTPLTKSSDGPQLIEFFHGPTAAFKDVGARFLAACLTRLEGDVQAPLTILVATSGDTGGAVAAAFNDRPGMRVVVLFPRGRVSGRQQHQLTCWGENVLSLSVDGAFDDCQALVKEAMADERLRGQFRFSSANSINIGRLLPQSTYYADSSLRHFRQTSRAPGYIIPTGNLGNALACIMAREMGFPIGPIVLATNANRTIPDYFETLEWVPRASVPTLASAMDVGNPSNMERLRGLLGEADVLRDRLGVLAVDDAQIEDEIRRDFDEFKMAVCPHTATATYTWRTLSDNLRAAYDWVLVATAHAAKFETVVEPLIGATVPVPPELENLLARPSRFVSIAPTLEELSAAMEEHFG
jgi:threonine synthase